MLKVNSNNWPPFRQVQPTTFMSGQLAHHTYVLVSTLAQAGFVEFIGVHVTTKRYTSVIAGAMPLLCTLGQKNKFFLSPQFLKVNVWISEEVHNSVNENIYRVYFMYTLCVKFVWKMYLTNLVQAETCDHNFMCECCSAKYES